MTLELETKTLPISTAENMLAQLVNMGAKVRESGGIREIHTKKGLAFKIEGTKGNVQVSWAAGLFDKT